MKFRIASIVKSQALLLSSKAPKFDFVVRSCSEKLPHAVLKVKEDILPAVVLVRHDEAQLLTVCNAPKTEV